jgi:hypothetical protein
MRMKQILPQISENLLIFQAIVSEIIGKDSKVIGVFTDMRIKIFV